MTVTENLEILKNICYTYLGHHVCKTNVDEEVSTMRTSSNINFFTQRFYFAEVKPKTVNKFNEVKQNLA